MRQTIVDRISKLAKAMSLDAILTSSPENFAYLTGFVVPTQPMIRHRHAMAMVTASGEVALFGVDMEASTIAEKAPGVPLTVWREFHDDAMGVLADMLRKAGLSAGAIGLELDYLPAGDFARLEQQLPAARFVAAEGGLARARQIKTAEEVELLQRLSRIADRSIADAIAGVQPGDSEMDIAAILTRRLYEQGAQDFKLMIVATGPRSQLPNVGPSTRKLQQGDICRIEIFAVADGYQAGVCRTASVGEPSAIARDIWNVIVDCKYAILERIRPGASCRGIYNDFIARLERHKLPPISFVGHGIGLHLHEDPYLGATPLLGRPGEDALIEANMVLGFEPLCYRTGHGFGVQNKDVLHVTDHGAQLLSDITETDQLSRIG
jgi:Xaa-Pro dipeptidase